MIENFQGENFERFEGNEESLPASPGQSNKLSKSQKIAAAVLVVFAFFVISLWFIQFKKSITSPLTYQGESQISSVEQEQANYEAQLKGKDSDKDGLSDWDELNLYKTSPYLEDSDSDGFSDKEEVINNKDPNCPAGRTCQEVKTESSANPNLEPIQPVLGNNENNLSEQSAKEILEGQTDVGALRQMLLQAGMDKNILDKISDEDLMKSYKEILKGQQ